MLQAAIAGFFVWLIIKILEKGKDNDIDGWLSFGFVLAPALLIFLISIAVSLLNLPSWIILASTLLYLVVPALMLKFQNEMSWGKSCSYGGIVLVVTLLVQYGLVYGFAVIST